MFYGFEKQLGVILRAKGKAEDIMFIYFNSVPISMALAPVEGRIPHINHPFYRPA
jgi:hypothetical protein